MRQPIFLNYAAPAILKLCYRTRQFTTYNVGTLICTYIQLKHVTHQRTERTQGLSYESR